ncbi:Disintegrin and metalloproteinase domain-containing protein 10 [Geodia barretti]|uniref:Disintegrin and metalloproteinase domain-containing protein 10 n=1 Tax=Geodia barretti TaxID=519541 RepID=A0AA35WXW2_GEOBA|nr:Disintegrin and metalloproteinase domain-containing protein 10 [Geodia barretti]
MVSFLGLCWAVFMAAPLSPSLALRIPFLRRYEPLNYDLELLTRQHHSLRARSADQDSSISLQFTAMHRPFDLVLVPDTSLFHEDLSVSSSRGPLPSHHLLSSTFTGYDRNTPGSRVHGNLISGVLDGTIYTNDEIYYIEPAHRYARDTQHHSIVYRHSDINTDALRGARCGVSDDHSSLVGYLERMGRSMLTPGDRVTPEYRSKRQSGSSLVRCDLNVTGDYLFYQEVTRDLGSLSVREKEEVALSLLVSYVQGASEIYKRTDFDSDSSTSDNIQFGIRDLVIETTASLPPFDSPFIGVERFLQEHSRSSNFRDTFCLHYRFTHRDFDGGVLGLAYVAKENSRGGICQNELNTGIVTTLNYGRRVAPQVTVLTFAHEVGHNFGSEHDPESSDCAPGGSGGNFIMYAFATSGSQGNNNRFSTCSRESMRLFIRTRGQEGDDACFSDASDVCQNRVLDDDEACDCGIDFDQDTHLCNDDPCCNGTSCQLTNSAACSRGQGVCCDPDTCQFLGTSVVCADLTDCGLPSNCTYPPYTPHTQHELNPFNLDTNEQKKCGVKG